MIYVTRRECFNAAHKLFRPDWTDQENLEYYGKCANPNWHGHNYTLFVTVKGEIDPEIGYCVNLKDISGVIKEYVTNKLDHKNLNLDVDFMKGKMTSTEVIAMEIWKQLENPVDNLGCKLHCVKLVETENNFVEYFGNQK
jgi:6-pyruvoyltetrahydropterin/6-carboxytetrahydropterin synthase